MEPLEKYIKENRKEFDYIKTDDSDWKSLQSALNQPVKGARVVPIWRKPLRYAAVVMALVGCFFIFRKEVGETEIKEYVGLEEQMYLPDVSLRNPSGEVISVSDLKGKVVLVDFWASYCMMCTEEHCYYFKPLYQDFRDKGFEIYSISVDESEDKWVQSIKKNDLDWIHVSDLMGNESPIYQKYKVDELPSNFLLDQEGRIVAKNIDADELEFTLNTLLAYKH